MTNSLTDHMIESELATPTHFVSNSLVGLFTHDDMRAAADWQLEKDSEWLRNFLIGSGAFTYGMANATVEEFRKAMRPQEDNL